MRSREGWTIQVEEGEQLLFNFLLSTVPQPNPYHDVAFSPGQAETRRDASEVHISTTPIHTLLAYSTQSMSASPIKGVHPITGELTMTLPEPRHTPQRVTPTPTPTPGPEPEIPVAGPSTTPVPAVMKKAVKRSTKVRWALPVFYSNSSYRRQCTT